MGAARDDDYRVRSALVTAALPPLERLRGGPQSLVSEAQPIQIYRAAGGASGSPPTASAAAGAHARGGAGWGLLAAGPGPEAEPLGPEAADHLLSGCTHRAVVSALTILSWGMVVVV